MFPKNKLQTVQQPLKLIFESTATKCYQWPSMFDLSMSKTIPKPTKMIFEIATVKSYSYSFYLAFSK